MTDQLDTIDAIVVKEFLASYLKYPPVGRDGDGDPHCVGCGATTLDLDDEFDMVPIHVFRCRACQRAIQERESTILRSPAPTPSYLDGTIAPAVLGTPPMTFDEWVDAVGDIWGDSKPDSTPTSSLPDDGWDPVGERQPTITDLSKAPTFPAAALCAGWDPNAPFSATNHPPCVCCDEGVESAPCTCGDWEALNVEE